MITPEQLNQAIKFALELVKQAGPNGLSAVQFWNLMEKEGYLVPSTYRSRLITKSEIRKVDESYFHPAYYFAAQAGIILSPPDEYALQTAEYSLANGTVTIRDSTVDAIFSNVKTVIITYTK